MVKYKQHEMALRPVRWWYVPIASVRFLSRILLMIIGAAKQGYCYG
jgi:hypothetical protein